MLLYIFGWLRLVVRVRAVAAELVAWQRDQRENAQSISREEAKIDHPKITVLLPVKGVHENTFNNWHSQIASTHGGDMEFIFAMESEQDPAYDLAMKFKEEVSGRPKVTIKVVNCGLTWYCTQKIHNLLEATCEISPDSKYVLFLDDDAEMRSEILKEMIRCLETKPDVMIASGWPHDYISSNTRSIPFSGYMMRGYRSLSSISLHRPSGYVDGIWGGCLLWRRDELLSDQVGVIEAWEACGYSDDMIMGGRTKSQRKMMVVPAHAFLPTKIQGDYSVRKHWNYIFRQMYVCDTYHDIYDRLNNLQLLVGASFLLLVPCIFFHLQVLFSAIAVMHRAVTDPWRFTPSRLVSSQGPGCGDAPWNLSCDALLLLILLVYLCWSEASFTATRGMDRICELMQPNRGDGRYAHQISQLTYRFNFFFGMIAHCILHASAAVWALLHNHVVWSGIHYYKKRGKVSQVWRPDGKGALHTVDREEARAAAIAARKGRRKYLKAQ